MTRARHLGLCFLVGFVLGPPAQAEVVRSSPSGFVVHHTAIVKAGPDAAWAALVQPARWWSKAHTWSGNAGNLVLDPRAGGCFCETLPDGGSAQHMQVIQFVPASMLRLKGALGPLQSEALKGVLTIQLKPGSGVTTVEWTYVVGGSARFPLPDIASAVDTVLGEQSTRLATLIERGDPEQARKR